MAAHWYNNRLLMWRWRVWILPLSPGAGKRWILENIHSLNLPFYMRDPEKAPSRETLPKGKTQYSWPPCTNLFRLAVFDNTNIIYFFIKQLSRGGQPYRGLPLLLVFPAPSLDLPSSPECTNTFWHSVDLGVNKLACLRLSEFHP